MKRTFTKLMAALALLTFLAVPLGMWGQSDYSTNYTGNITLSTTGGTSASTCTVKINDFKYNGIKAGTNNAAGAMKITVPANTKYLHLHLAGWNGQNVALTVSPNGYSSDISLTSNSGISGSSTDYVWGSASGDQLPNSTSHYKVITFTMPLSEATTLTFTAKSGKRFVVWGVSSEEDGDPTYTVTYDCNGGTSNCPENVTGIEPDDEITLADAPSKTGHAFDGWNDGTSTYVAGFLYTVTGNVTMTAQWTAYTVTAQSNNNSYGTVSVSGFTITASPASGYQYASPAYTVSSGTASVVQNGNTFTVTPSSNCTITINFVAIPKHFATFSVNGATTSFQVAEGAAITFPDDPANIDEMVFMGWTTTPIDGTTDDAPTFVTSATMSNSDVTFYAVFATETSQGPTEETLTITPETFGNSLTGSYSTITKTITVGGENYTIEMNACKQNDQIQMRDNATISFIYFPSLPGDIKRVYTTECNNASGSTYAGTIHLKNKKTRGNTDTDDITKATLSSVNSFSIDMPTNNKFFYLLTSAGLRLSNLTVVYEVSGTTTYSGYCTTVGTTPASYINLVAYHESYQNPYLIEFPEYDGDVTWNFATVESNLEITDLTNYHFQFYNEVGTEIETPDWIMEIDVHHASVIEQAYDIANVFYISAHQNTGAERTTYFKVWANDADNNPVYSSLVTVIQPGVPQDLTVTLGTYVDAIYVFDANDDSAPLIANGDEGTVKVAKGTSIMVSPVVAEGFVLQTLMVGNEDVTSQIDESGAYTFTMPSQIVTITATAQEAPADYVRITSLAQLKDGSKVIIAARYDSYSNHYYAMKSTSLTNGKAEGEQFTSTITMSGTKEILPSEIANTDEGFYWTVSVTDYGYTFTNKSNQTISGSSSASFGFNGNNSYWDVDNYIANGSAMVSGYAGFKIVNADVTDRAFALNTSHNFGPYATSNMSNTTANQYNFSLDFFVQEEVELGSYDLSIGGYLEGDEDGYYLIASPVTVNPKDIQGFTAGTFDLYSFDESEEDHEWRNYEAANGHFKLVPGHGYLYAKQTAGATSQYDFTLTGMPYNSNGVIELSYTEGNKWAGWNLVGNPFAQTAYIDRDCYVMNDDHNQIIATDSREVAVMQGVFVVAESANETVAFSTTASDNNTGAKVVMNVVGNQGVADRAIVRFGEGRQLPKFQLNENSTKLYFSKGNQDYAVVRSGNEGEMALNFKASRNGRYTMSVNIEALEMSYLHLFDNKTGNDVDLLATPSYTFNANTGDNVNRFRLVFKANADVEENTATETFAYFNGSEWIINNNGNATLQVVDMMGRVLSSETISGNANITLNQAAGIYMLRLVNGENVKVQKVVVR